MLNKRSCGILLHPTSLPGPGGIGSLGADARRFINLLSDMGMSYWQVLPLAPPACGNSPYSAFSAFAGNPLLIDLEQLVQEGDLDVVPELASYPETRVDFAALVPDKTVLLYRAAEAFLAADSSRSAEFRLFQKSTPWLHDFALFMALKRQFQGASWIDWPAQAARPDAAGRAALAGRLGHQMDLEGYLQWQFARQWHDLRGYACGRGIAVIGDIPIFVAHDSADVWANRELFLLNEAGSPRLLAGVPPDYFSATGQLWGNPLYDWGALEGDGYRWWIERFRSSFALFDLTRVDHFRGFEAAWQVPAGAPTAEAGQWVKGPGKRLFDAVQAELGRLPIIAEDLGVITPEVIELRERYHFPGMKILQFAFDTGFPNPDLPHNHMPHTVVYTGTHDNDTSNGWCRTLADAERLVMRAYLGSSGEDCATELVRAALRSVADTAVLPLQDVLGLESEARMNIPGTPLGNWEWRFTWDMLPAGLAARLRDQLELFGRLNKGGNSHAR